MTKVGINSRSAGIMLALSFCLALSASCARKIPKSQIDPNAYARELEQWRAQRLAELKSDTGWLTLSGLFWLKEGRNSVGQGQENDIIVPPDKMPLHLGAFVLTNGEVIFETPIADNFYVNDQPISAVVMKSDADDKPTVMTLRSFTFQLIKRGDKLGVRIKDRNSPQRSNFSGLEYFPTDLNWRLDARFEPYNPPKPMPITNVLGMESSESSPGAVKFEVDGKEYRIDAITEKGERHLFMIISDKTSGKDTYPAGRYLYVDPPDAFGRMVIDFNKAFSPPCAFTKFATCPLPPRQNRLPFAIEAGEKYQRH
jgi:uncharacterized protein (DUF1684 family)